MAEYNRKYGAIPKKPPQRSARKNINKPVIETSKPSDEWIRKSEKKMNELELLRLPFDQPDLYKHCVLQVKKDFKDETVVARNIDDSIEDEIVIRGPENRGKSFHGDEVVVKILTSLDGKSEDTTSADGVIGENTRPLGKVIGVIRSFIDPSDWTILCTADNNNTDLLIPIDRTIPNLTNYKTKDKKGVFKKEGHVSIYQYNENSRNVKFKEYIPVISNSSQPDLFYVRFLSWTDVDPMGIAVGVVPSETPLARSMRLLRLTNRNPDGFSQAVQKEVEGRFPIGKLFVIPEEELGRRSDYTKVMTFTIDPPDSNDIDDALSLEELADGSLLVGVHIADVSFFVRPGTPLDDEARRRGSSIYEVAGKDPNPMLPDRLSTDLCSLQESQQRLTLSVFLTLNSNHDVVRVEVKRTVIRSRFRLEYTQIEAILVGKSSDRRWDFEDELLTLCRIARRWRKMRIGYEEYFRQTNNLAYTHSPIAHMMVEEMMIAANREVAKLLLEHFPICTPLLVQPVPAEFEMMDWRMRFPCEAEIIDMTQPFLWKYSHQDVKKSIDNTKKKFALHKAIWDEMKETLKSGNVERLQSLILSPEYHPSLIVAWFNFPSFTKKARHACSGELQPDQWKHFSLNVPQYTQFTSPIRRYLDIVVHRLLHLIIDDESKKNDYSQSRVSALCKENQNLKSKISYYENSVNTAHFAEYLRRKPMIVNALVERVVETGFKLNALKLSKFAQLYPIDISHFGAKEKKVIQQHRRGKMLLKYSMRIYDLKENSVNELEEANGRLDAEVVKLSNRRHIIYTTLSTWKDLTSSAVEGDKDKIIASVEILRQSIIDPEIQQNSDFTYDVTCEGNVLRSGRNAVDFSLAITAGDVVEVQLAGEIVSGKLRPIVQLYSLSPTIAVCLEHRNNSVKCFSAMTGLLPMNSYEHKNIQSYVEAWMPLLVLESAENAIARNDSFILHHVSTIWHDNLFGSFRIPVEFCRERCIEFCSEEEEDDDEVDNMSTNNNNYMGFLCMRYSGVSLEAPGTELPIGNVTDLSGSFTWVGHCVVTNIRRNRKEEEVTFDVRFRLNQSSSEIPKEILNGIKPTIEWISNTQKERNVMKMMSSLQNQHTSTYLANILALNHMQPPPLKKGYLKVVHQEMANLNGIFDEIQEQSISEALTQSLTFIHGQLSSGKTLLAAQLAYRFTKVNRRIAARELKRRQVLCLCPTDGSLWSIAEYLQADTYRMKAVLVCRRAEELPSRLSIDVEGLRQKKWKGVVCLHQMIRNRNTDNSQFIRQMDEDIALQRKHISCDDMKKYLHCIASEESIVLHEADVIICSSETVLENRIKLNTNIKQVIIDDSQAFTEAETLCPLSLASVSQVVLIGDLKQLKTRVHSSVVRKYGLMRSLFERCLCDDQKPTLTIQYSMNKALLEFLGKTFYNKLKPSVGDLKSQSKRSSFKFWPRGRDRPFLFLNVIGTERTTKSSTNTNTDTDFYNQEETAVAINIVTSMLERLNISSKSIAILSPYKAQCLKIEEHFSDNQDLMISTASSAHGRHWDFVVLSTVRSCPESEITSLCNNATENKTLKHKSLGLLCDRSTSNVLLSRATDGLIIIGNRMLLQCDESWKKVIQHFEKFQSIVDSSDFVIDN